MAIKKVMVTHQYGAPIYIAPALGDGIEVTDKLSEAEVWGENDTETKLKYHRAITCWDGIQFETIESCQVIGCKCHAINSATSTINGGVLLVCLEHTPNMSNRPESLRKFPMFYKVESIEKSNNLMEIEIWHQDRLTVLDLEIDEGTEAGGSDEYGNLEELGYFHINSVEIEGIEVLPFLTINARSLIRETAINQFYS